MNDPHELTEEFIHAVRAREALARIDRELSELPAPLSQAQYVERRQKLTANEDRAGLAALDKEITGARLTRASLQKLRQERQHTLDALQGKDSSPTKDQENQVANSHMIPRAPAPFIEPTILLLRARASAAAPIVKPVPQQEHSPARATLLPGRGEARRKKDLSVIRGLPR